jgi:hypothetical protein
VANSKFRELRGLCGVCRLLVGLIFPGAIVVVTKVLPGRLHVSAIGFVAAVGASGVAVMPFITRAIAFISLFLGLVCGQRRC